MLGALLFALCACLLWWASLRWWALRRFWAKRNVPHLPPHPVMGSLSFLQKQNPAVWLRSLYAQVSAPCVGVWLLWRPALVVQSPLLARRVLIQDADNFRNRSLGSGSSDPIGSLNLLTINDPIWSSIRQRVSAVFTSAKLRALQMLVQTKADELVQRIQSETDKNIQIDLKSVYADFTTDIIGTASFGIASDATLTGDSTLRIVTRDFQKYTAWRGLSWSSIFFFPELVDICRFSLFPKDTTAFLTKVFRAVVKQRGGYEQEVGTCKDLLDYLLKIKQEAARDNEDISEEMLMAQATIFIQGGFDTTATALTYLTYELAFNLEIQEKLHKELLEAKQQVGNKSFDINGLSELPYLNAVIKETIRKYPPMGWIDRIAAKDYKIDDTLTIPAGMPVYVNAIGMQSDPKYFPDPERFDPDRFLPENEHNIVPYTYIPFGDGPRNCIGRRFAHLVMCFGASAIFLNYAVRPWPDSPPPSECQLERRGLLLMPEGALSVQFVPRTSS